LSFGFLASWKIAGLLPSGVPTGQPLTQPKESQSKANYASLILPHKIEFLVMMHGLGNQTGAFWPRLLLFLWYKQLTIYLLRSSRVSNLPRPTNRVRINFQTAYRSAYGTCKPQGLHREVEEASINHFRFRHSSEILFPEPDIFTSLCSCSTQLTKIGRCYSSQVSISDDVLELSFDYLAFYRFLLDLPSHHS
jgi:hypothetical protein